MFGKQKIEELESENQQLQRGLEEGQARVRGQIQHGRALQQRFQPYFEQLIDDLASAAQRFVAEGLAHDRAGWDSSGWQLWQPPVPDADTTKGTTPPGRIRVGELLDPESSRGELTFAVPAYTPFIGHRRTIIICSSGESHERGCALLQSLIARTAFLLPHQAEFTLLDPAGNGAAFPMRRHLPFVKTSTGDTRRDLDQIIQHIQQVYENYLDESYPSFELVDAHLRLSERFQVVVAADFPNKYDRRAIEALQSVANTGPATGTYTFIHYNTEVSLPRDISMDSFEFPTFVDLTNSNAEGGLTLRPDSAPAADLQELLFTRLRASKPPERRVAWDEVVGLPEESWWKATSEEAIRSPIGALGAKGTLELWFGVNGDVPCAHGMLGAMTGAGKSNLYHVLILGLCVRYSPDELRLFLVDGKDGVEFHPYRDLPHAEVVSLHSSPELSRSVLHELVNEKERRNSLFPKVGAVDYLGYRKLGQPEGVLPRILFLVDEYQELFEDDKDGIASALLRQLAEQGRSAGIHLLLGSQRFGAAGMLNQTAIFGNIHLRMAMQMTGADVQALSEFGRRGKQLIRRCDLPGKIVVNHRSGDDGTNEIGKVAFLEADERQELLKRLVALADATTVAEDVLPTVVFDGRAQPNLVENPYVKALLSHKSWLEEAEFQRFARQDMHDGGLGIPNWFHVEKPSVLWLGQEFSVRAQAALTLRRRGGENAVVIGGSNACRYGMLASLLASMALNVGPEKARFVVIDRSLPDTDWSNTLQRCCERVLARVGYNVDFRRTKQEAEEALDRYLVELDRRRALPEGQLQKEPTLIVVATELDRVDTLCARPDISGLTPSPAGEQLQRIAVEGPAVGIHLLLSFEGVRALARVVDERRGLVHFRHRVALQMSEDDSLTLVRSRRAAQLQLGGPSPVCALYVDLESDSAHRFKPYSIEASPPFDSQLDRIGSILAKRRLSS